MTWYYLLFFICLGIFLLKTLISIFFGDIDLDVDFDGDTDFDTSTLFSFKGILHFLLGFSTYLVGIARLNVNSATDFEFAWYHYLIATFVGFLLMIMLYYSYKLMMKFNHYSDSKLNLTNYTCSILNYNGKVDNDIHSYTVLVNTEQGSQKINIISNNGKLANGSSHIIKMNEQGIYYI